MVTSAHRVNMAAMTRLITYFVIVPLLNDSMKAPVLLPGLSLLNSSKQL
jgi:hypothetical protein